MIAVTFFAVFQEPLYFIWMQNDASDQASDQAKQEAAYIKATGKGKETDKADADVTSYKDVTYFQTGQSYEQKFTTHPSSWSFKKSGRTKMAR